MHMDASDAPVPMPLWTSTETSHPGLWGLHLWAFCERLILQASDFRKGHGTGQRGARLMTA